jgi:hypothetical protein
MTLIELESGKCILIDINIRQTADDEDDDTPDVAAMLRERLKKDGNGRFYVDAFLLSHPDEDHCRGLARHFHLGKPDDHPGDDKILIREMWSSPLVFRRASKNHPLCDDAKAWNKEAKRRVKAFRDGKTAADGDRILIMGEDEDGKTDDLTDILIKVDGEFSRINGQAEFSMSARLLAPLPKSNDKDEEDQLTKNNSSVVLRFKIRADGISDACRYLIGGDAEVFIWEKLWGKHKNKIDWINYDLLLTPHHCSWHSLSHDSWSEKGEDAEVSTDARNALSQTRDGAYLIASSKEIKDDDNDPPCWRAKREYEAIAGTANGLFKRVSGSNITEFEISGNGPKMKTKYSSSATIIGGGAIGGQSLHHG